METSQNNKKSHLFLVRLWLDQEEEDRQDNEAWQGTIQHVLTGKAATFHDWSDLQGLLREMTPPTRYGHSRGETEEIEEIAK
jgi:hypothetical protein